MKINFSFAETLFVLVTSIITGVPAAIKLFIDIFWTFDPIVFLIAGFFILQYGVFIVGGALSGTLLVTPAKKA